MQAHADYREIRDFAGYLDRFIGNLNDDVRALNGEFHKLCDTWDDDQTRDFENTLKDLEVFLSRFNSDAEEQVKWLRKVADHLEEYKNM
ncbi:FIG00710451: hypothetical protein [Helicobacter heilmannii]|uniref:hypothetical protein n=1 Tax=Helicobacter heilmannii TaxID=35817 RepID=UPI0006A24D98|nr:hypothetical protein [Helicobacter heilmannii]CRF48713.1 FIG00710451: hypothetical protein [Helicobacter heilmannii]